MIIHQSQQKLEHEKIECQLWRDLLLSHICDSMNRNKYNYKYTRQHSNFLQHCDSFIKDKPLNYQHLILSKCNERDHAGY